MIARRKFIKNTALGAAALSLGSLESCAEKTTKVASKGPMEPICIATWNNRKAVAAAAEALQKGRSALDAVEAGARVPESDPEDTSVGYGGFPDRDGHVTLDACIMDEKGRAGSVVFVQNTMHVVSLARLVMEKTPHVLLAGKGAEQFAEANGFPKENLLTPTAEKAWREWLAKNPDYKPRPWKDDHDTIGIIAVDKAGRASGACTTSGRAFKMHGRVGDSPIVGAGLFVDDEVGAATCTGLGEMALRNLTAFLTVELMRQGRSPQKACEEAIARMAQKEGDFARSNQFCVIALDKKGRHGGFSLLPGFEFCLLKNGKIETFKSASLFEK